MSEIINDLSIALYELEKCSEFAGLIPEVRTNLVYAKKGAKTPIEVAAIDGRITVVKGQPKAAGKPSFGVSSHMARLIIELSKTFPEIRAGIDFANNPEFVNWLEKYCYKKGWHFGVIDRDKEPQEAIEKEEGSIPWKVKEIINVSKGKTPKIFYETPAIGKEPLTFLVGEDPMQIVNQICEIAKEVNREPWGKYIR